MDVICLCSGKVSDSSVPREHSLEENATEQVEAGGPYPRMNLKTVNMGVRIHQGSRPWCGAGGPEQAYEMCRNREPGRQGQNSKRLSQVGDTVWTTGAGVERRQLRVPRPGGCGG